MPNTATKNETWTIESSDGDLTITVEDEYGHEFAGIEAHTTRQGYVYVKALAVDADHSGQGYGRALVSEVVARYPGKRLEIVVKEGEKSHRMAAMLGSMGFRHGPSANTTRDARDSDARRFYLEATAI